jgi:hypothetical protein
MADNTIIIRSEEVYIEIGGRRITALPATGTYLLIEKISARSTFIEGQHGTTTFVRNNSKGYRVSVTMVQGSDDDAHMIAAIAALDATNSVLPVIAKWSGTKYVSGSGDIEVIPNRELAADSNPSVTYAIVGTFPVAIVASFGQPPVLGEDQIASFLPPA